MKTKKDFYVLVDTAEKGKEVQGILEMFGEYRSNVVDGALLGTNIQFTIETFKYLYFTSYSEWSLHSKPRKDLTLITVGALRNVLALESLKSGDKVVLNTPSGEAVLKVKSVEGAIIEADTLLYLDDLTLFTDVKHSLEDEWVDFLRFASKDEEILLGSPRNTIPSQELVKGQWYKHYFNCEGQDGYILFRFNGEFGEESQYGFTHGGQYSEDISIYKGDRFRKASLEEVEKACSKVPPHYIKSEWFDDFVPPLPKQIDKFTDIKKAHKEGATIQYKSKFPPYQWVTITGRNPAWDKNFEYRVKPQEIFVGDWVSYKSGDIRKVTQITQGNLNHYRKQATAYVITDTELIEKLNNL